MKRILLLCCIIFVLSFESLYPQSKKVSLKECVEIALQQHPQIKIASEDRKKSIANYKTAKSLNKILVQGEVKTVEYLNTDRDANDTNIPGRDTSFGLFAGVTATYNLIDPKESKMEDMARISIDLMKMNTYKVRQKIVVKVKEAYYDYIMAREGSVLREELLGKFEDKLKLASKLFKNGLRPILDVSKAEVDLSNARFEYEKSKNSEKLMKTMLLASMGILDTEITVQPIKVDTLPKLRYKLKELYQLSEYNYPGVGIAKFKKKINKISIEIEQSASYPRVDLFASLGFENQLDNSDFDNTDTAQDRFLTKGNWEPTVHAGLSAKFPIFSRGGIEGRVEAAVAEYRKSEYNEKEIQLNIRGMIRAYLQSMNEYSRQIQVSSMMIENAKKHLELAQKSYQNGIGSLLDMNDAEMSVVRARFGLIEARYEYLKTLAKISNIVGIGEEHLCK